ncbi:hypothetical protein AB6A40_009374 [Gnathostoma spinigerum]|uniref:Uncharacterized protein n=1 Tax=Gnathostoma spinigerum TaxID=75299 RepID=A0ABD6F1H5_9BILA
MQIEWKNTGKDTTKGTLDWSSNSQLKSEFDHQMMGISTRLNQTKVEKTPWNVARVGHPMMLNSTALTVTDERQSALETIAPTTTPMPPAILRSSSLSVGSTVSFDWPSSSPSKIMTNIDSESSTERQTLHPWLATTAGLNWPSTTPVAAMRTPPSAITTDEKMDRAVVLATTTTEPSSTSTLRTTTTTTTRKTVPSTPPQTTTTPTITTPTTSTPPPPTTTTTITATTTTMRPPTTPSSPSLSSSSATTTKTTPTTSTTANTPQIWNTPVVSTQLPSAKYTPSVVPMVMITERRTTFETKSSSDKNAAAAMTTKVLSPYLRPFRPLSVKVYSQTAHGSLAGGLSESAQTLSMSQLKARRMSASENSMDAKRSDDQSNKGQTLNYGDAPILEGADLTGAKGFESEVFQETAALLSRPISTKITTTFPPSESIPSELISAKFTSSDLLAAPQRTLHRSINGFSAPDDDVASGVLSVAHSSSPTTATVINSEIRGDQQAIAVKSRKTSPTRIIYQSVPRTSWSIGGGGKKVGWQRSTSYSQPSLYFLSWFTLLHLVFSSQLILK